MRNGGGGRVATMVVGSPPPSELDLSFPAHWAGGHWPRVSQAPTQKPISLRPSNFVCACCPKVIKKWVEVVRQKSVVQWGLSIGPISSHLGISPVQFFFSLLVAPCWCVFVCVLRVLRAAGPWGMGPRYSNPALPAVARI